MGDGGGEAARRLDLQVVRRVVEDQVRLDLGAPRAAGGPDPDTGALDGLQRFALQLRPGEEVDGRPG
jgi:hypothetical protein